MRRGRRIKPPGPFALRLSTKHRATKRVEFSHKTPVVIEAETRLGAALTAHLRTIGKHVAGKLSHLAKPAQMSAREDEADALASADWDSVAQAVADETVPVAKAGAQNALTVIGVADDESIVSQTYTRAVDAARSRSAEMVGKSWDEDGNLVDNPDAEWAITDTLRDDIRAAVAQAIEDGDSPAQLAKRIEEMPGFSADRAIATARTEIIMAHAQGQMAAMRESGVVEQKAWSTAGEEVCDECQANEDMGPIGLEDDFTGGDDAVDAPPMHPMCRCSVVAYIPEPGQTAEEDEDESAAAE